MEVKSPNPWIGLMLAVSKVRKPTDVVREVRKVASPTSLNVVFIALILWIVEVIIFIVLLRKKPWITQLLTQIVILVMIWPTSQLAFKVIYYKDTREYKAKSVTELGVKTNIPKECKEITYHTEPTGRWFYCKIDSKKAISWLEKEKFKPEETSYCGPFDNLPIEINKMLSVKHAQYFVTDFQPNGAGAGATLLNDRVFVCQWYW